MTKTNNARLSEALEAMKEASAFIDTIEPGSDSVGDYTTAMIWLALRARKFLRIQTAAETQKKRKRR